MREIEFKITKAEEGAAFAVHIVPQSAENEVVGKHGDALKIRLTAKSASGLWDSRDIGAWPSASQKALSAATLS